MANRTMRTKAGRAIASIVIGLGVATGGAVTFAPPAHAMLPADGGSSTKALKREYNAQMRRYQEQMQQNQRNYQLISDILKRLAELRRAMADNMR